MVTFEPYRKKDRAWVLSANVRHYRDVEGFNNEFGGAVTHALDHLESQFYDQRSMFRIVQDEERRIGCIFFSAETSTKGRIRLFYLDSGYRRVGIGRRLLGSVISHAAEQGFEKLLVSTFKRHEGACRLYVKCGFIGIAKPETEAFGQKLTQIDFALALTENSESET